ncbi:hypothetical protein PFISCL1PPCAC_13951, partial [Pristionchus fissidentatus]
HPMAFLLNVRETVTPTKRIHNGHVFAAPHDYSLASSIHEPSSTPSNFLGRVRLADVIAYRAKTVARAAAEKRNLIKIYANDAGVMKRAFEEGSRLAGSAGCSKDTPAYSPYSEDASDVENDEPTDASSSTGMMRPGRVLYRIIKMQIPGVWMLEACHFEIFLPDRLDLRYIRVPYDLLMEELHERELIWITADNLTVMASTERKTHVDHTLDYPVEWKLCSLGEVESYPQPAVIPQVPVIQYGTHVDYAYSLVPDYSFPIISYDLPEPPTSGATSTIVKADMHVREANWVLPCEPVRDREIYACHTACVR